MAEKKISVIRLIKGEAGEAGEAWKKAVNEGRDAIVFDEAGNYLGHTSMGAHLDEWLSAGRKASN